MGALKWGLKPTHCNLRTIVYNCALLWPFLGPFLRANFRRKMTTIVGYRGQLWTSTLSPHLLSPHLDFPECENWPSALSCTFSWALEKLPWALEKESSWGPSGWCVLHRKRLNLRGHFRGHLCVHSRVHFREHFRERVCGSNFAVRVLCAFLTKSPSVSRPSKLDIKQGHARGAASKAQRGISFIHFYCPVPQSSSHIGPHVNQHFTYGVVGEGVTAENFPQLSAKFPQLSAEFPHAFLTQ